MKKKLFTLPKLFLLYLVAVLGFFIYAGLTGTRILGDDTEKYDPAGPDRSGGSGRNGHRFQHK